MGSRLRVQFLVLLLAGCGGQEKSTSKYIPDIPVECTAAQAADCSGTGLTLFAGLKESLGAECDDYLSGMNATLRRSNFTASATATTGRSGIYLTANLMSWENAWGGAIDTLEAGSYQICAFIDTNGNSVIDTNEPVGTGIVEMGTNNFVLETWSPAFN